MINTLDWRLGRECDADCCRLQLIALHCIAGRGRGATTAGSSVLWRRSRSATTGRDGWTSGRTGGCTAWRSGCWRATSAACRCSSWTSRACRSCARTRTPPCTRCGRGSCSPRSSRPTPRPTPTASTGASQASLTPGTTSSTRTSYHQARPRRRPRITNHFPFLALPTVDQSFSSFHAREQQPAQVFSSNFCKKKIP